MTATGMFVGTVDYIAPEQIEGHHIDGRADTYSLGCVLYEALSGSVPFPRDSEIPKIFAHVNDPPPRLANVPAPLADENLLKTSGRGIFLMRTFMDEFEVHRSPQGGAELVMAKKLVQRPAAPHFQDK